MKSGAPIRDHFLHRPQPRADYRHTTGKRFDYRHREILIPLAGEDQAPRPFYDGDRFVAWQLSKKTGVDNSRLSCMSLQGRTLRTAADDAERNAHLEPMPRLQERHHALLRIEPSDKQRIFAASGPASRIGKNKVGFQGDLLCRYACFDKLPREKTR